MFTQYLGASAFRKTEALSSSFKHKEYRRPSLYCPYCSHRTVALIQTFIDNHFLSFLSKVFVQTGRKVPGASTKAEVKLRLFGSKGKSESFVLSQSRTHKIPFQKGQEDVFHLEAFDVGPLDKIVIGHERREMEFSWFLEKVSDE